jgi:2-(3-amino-3-carboxypropyl)histidine synthase
MKTLFLEAKSNVDVIPAVEKAIKFLPKKIGIATTAQHKHKLKEIKDFLNKHNLKAEIAGQVLGCNAENAKKLKNKVDAFLYVGSGKFHPIQIQLETGKEVIIANPFTNEAKKLEKQETERIKQQQQGAYIRFLSSKTIGILVSTKPGQKKLKKAFELKKQIEKNKDKKCYIFIADTIDYNELQNFPFIECWLSTACPRFADEKKGILNIKTLEEASR